MLVEELIKKWQPVLEHPDLDEIKDPRRRAITAQLLENQEVAARTGGLGDNFSLTSLLEAAPINAMGASSSTASAGAVDIYDPVLISLVRRSMPNLMTYDVMGVQPMTGPVGLVFAMRSRYTSQTGKEAQIGRAHV